MEELNSAAIRTASTRAAVLLPEEDAIGDPDDADDEQDDTLPADLWY